jgi:hypothetical protein
VSGIHPLNPWLVQAYASISPTNPHLHIRSWLDAITCSSPHTYSAPNLKSELLVFLAFLSVCVCISWSTGLRVLKLGSITDWTSRSTAMRRVYFTMKINISYACSRGCGFYFPFFSKVLRAVFPHSIYLRSEIRNRHSNFTLNPSPGPWHKASPWWSEQKLAYFGDTKVFRAAFPYTW